MSIDLKVVWRWLQGDPCADHAAFLIIDDILKLAQRPGHFSDRALEYRRQLLARDRSAVGKQPHERQEVGHPLSGSTVRNGQGERIHTCF
jgi:hypothetical protein